MNTTAYWTDSASLPRFPSLSSDLTVDVVVIGGGITGITAAYLARQAGLSVALIDRTRFASIDTGHTTAHLTCVTDTRLHDLKKTFGRDAARAVWDAGGAGIDQIVSLIRSEAIACDFKWLPGYLHTPLDTRDRDGDELKREAEVALELGIAAEFLPAIPGYKVPGVKFPQQALFHPRKYLAGLLHAMKDAGVHLFEETAADEISDQPLEVKVGGHRLAAANLILATHNPLMGNTGTAAAMLFQTKLALYTSYALGAKVPRQSLPEGAFWDTSDPYFYLRVERRQDHDYAIFGGEDHKTGQEPDTAAAYARLEAKFQRYAPQAEIDHRWSGQVIETNDGLPLIGETAPGQFVATGFAGNGMTFGTLGAMMAVDAILKRPNPWAELFDVHRKKLRGGTWTYLTENKDYPYFLVRNWLAKAEGRSTDSVATGEGKILSLEGKKVAAYRDESGQVTLCSPVCTHLQCIVGWNTAEKTWDCPCHGSRFKPTGEVISGPAEEPLKKLAPVSSDGTPQPIEKTEST